MPGRPTAYSEEIAERFCEQIALGSNINRLCETDAFPERQTIYNWFKAHPSFFDNYARAREARADSRVDQIDDVVTDMRAGAIDHNQARVEIDAIKWQAGKENPKRYGDKVQQELSSPDGGTPVLNVVIRSVLDKP
jgi:terminase small subunit-like protein